jgi:hypothetical protein
MERNSLLREPEMCGPFVLMTPGKDLSERFGLEALLLNFPQVIAELEGDL